MQKTTQYTETQGTNMENRHHKWTAALKLLAIIGLGLGIAGCDVSTQQSNSAGAIHAQSDQSVCQDFMRYVEANQASRYLCRDGYVVNYNDQTKQPNWVAYRLTARSVSHHTKREEQFEADQLIPKVWRAELSDYQNSGYDRGHLAEFAAMDFSERSAKQSFLLSNISPQRAGLNRHGWAQLEKYVRFWAKAKGELYVYTGVIYRNKTPRTFIGQGKVAVPDYFYKVIYAPKQKESIAFVMPNQKVEKKDVAKYRVAIKDIQMRTGVNFFIALPAKERQRLINHVSPMWRTSYQK